MTAIYEHAHRCQPVDRTRPFDRLPILNLILILMRSEGREVLNRQAFSLGRPWADGLATAVSLALVASPLTNHIAGLAKRQHEFRSAEYHHPTLPALW